MTCNVTKIWNRIRSGRCNVQGLELEWVYTAGYMKFTVNNYIRYINM